MGKGRWVRALSVQKLLVYAPLLRWYVEHVAVIKPSIARSSIRRQSSSPSLWRRCRRLSALEVQIRAKRCWLRCSDCWEISVTGNSLKLWSAKRAWSTQKMRRWWTKRCERLTSAMWTSLAKPISCKVANVGSQLIDRSDRNRCLTAGKAANARVLLRFLGSVHRPPRLPADSDEH